MVSNCWCAFRVTLVALVFVTRVVGEARHHQCSWTLGLWWVFSNSSENGCDDVGECISGGWPGKVGFDGPVGLARCQGCGDVMLDCFIECSP